MEKLIDYIFIVVLIYYLIRQCDKIIGEEHNWRNVIIRIIYAVIVPLGLILLIIETIYIISKSVKIKIPEKPPKWL